MIRRTPLKRSTKPIKRVSERRAREMKIYAEKRKAYLAEFFLCQVDLAEKGFDPRQAPVRISDYYVYVWKAGEKMPTLVPVDQLRASIEVHHGAKRGKNYLVESTWWAVSRHWHDEIELHKKWARAGGYLR